MPLKRIPLNDIKNNNSQGYGSMLDWVYTSTRWDFQKYSLMHLYMQQIIIKALLTVIEVSSML